MEQKENNTLNGVFFFPNDVQMTPVALYNYAGWDQGQ